MYFVTDLSIGLICGWYCGRIWAPARPIPHPLLSCWHYYPSPSQSLCRRGTGLVAYWGRCRKWEHRCENCSECANWEGCWDSSEREKPEPFKTCKIHKTYICMNKNYDQCEGLHLCLHTTVCGTSVCWIIETLAIKNTYNKKYHDWRQMVKIKNLNLTYTVSL